MFKTQPLIKEKFRLYPEESAAILFGLLVIVYLIFPTPLYLLPEFIKVVLVFLAVIMFPGYLISSWITSIRKLFLRRVVFAFAFGYAVWAPPCSILLLINPSWKAFYFTFLAINLLLITLTIFFLRFKTPGPKTDEEVVPAPSSWRKTSSLVMLVLLLLSFIPLVIVAKTEYISGDLMAFVTQIRTSNHSPTFIETEPYFGTNIPAPLRMAINPWSLLPGFMIKVTGIDPIDFFSRNINGIYVILAILAIYLLVLEFTGNRDLALFTSLFTVILFMANPYPRLFSPTVDVLRRISADKFFLLYIILPVALALVRRFFVNGRVYSLILALFVALSIGLTHPLIVFFFDISTATFVAVSFLFLKKNRNRIIFKRSVLLAMLCIVVMIVPILQEFQYASTASQLYLDDFGKIPTLQPTTTLLIPFIAIHNLGIPGSSFPEVQPVKPGEVNPLTVVRLFSQMGGKKILLLTTDQYIAHPDTLINWPSIIALILTPLLLIWFRKDNLALLMISTTVVYLFLSFNPILTPMIGRFITPWMVYRLTWPIMVHFTLAYVLYQLISFLASLLIRLRSPFVLLAASLLPILALLIFAFSLKTHIIEFYQQTVNTSGNPLNFSDSLISFMRENIDGKDKVILSDISTNPMITAVLYRTYIVAHRYTTTNEIFPSDRQDEAVQRVSDVEYFTNAKLIDTRILHIINTYHVNYILVPLSSPLACQFAYLGSSFALIYGDNQYQLFQVGDTSRDSLAIQANDNLLAENYNQAEIDFTTGLQQDPNSIFYNLGISTALEGQGRYTDALEITKNAYRQDSQSICINRRLGDLYIALGDNNQAYHSYQTVASLNSRNHEDFKTLGDLSWALNQPDNADAAYRKAGELLFGENTTEYYQYLYGIYLNLKSPDRAFEYIQAAIKLGPSAQSYLLAGYGATVFGSSEEAAILIDKSLTSNPDENYMIAAYTALGDLYLGEGKYDEAINTYREGINQGIYKMDWETEAYMSIGNVYEEMGNTDKALNYYKGVERYDPSSSSPYLAIAQIDENQGNYQTSLVEIGKATIADPFDVTAYLQAAEVYDQLGMNEQMMTMYKQAISIDPYKDQAWILYGNRLLDQNNSQAAYQAFMRASDLRSSNPQIWLGFGNVARSQQKWEQALAYFNLAVLREPTSSEGYVAIGDVLGQIATLKDAADAYLKGINADPQNPIAYAKLSNTYRLLGEYDKALQANQDALSIEPDAVDVLLSLANTYFDQKNYNQAGDLYRHIIDLDPKQVRPYLALANISMLQNNDKVGTLELYQTAVKQNPTYSPAIVALGDFYLQHGQLDLAEDAYRLVIAFPTSYASDYQVISTIQQRKGEWDQALITLESAINKVADPGEAYRNLANYYLGRGLLNDAIASFQQAIQIDPKNSQSYADLARLAISLGDLDLAGQVLDQGSHNSDDQSVILITKASYLEAMGEMKQAEAELLSAINPPYVSIEPYQSLAQYYRDAGRYSDALSIYQQAQTNFPDNVELIIGMAQIYDAMGSTDEAVKWFQVAASIDKSDPSADIALSNTYLSHAQYLESEQVAQQALAINPSNAGVYLLIAQIYEAQNRRDQARWNYEQACSLDESNGDCLAGLSQIEWQAKQYDQSIVDIQKAITLQPGRIDFYQTLSQYYLSLGDSGQAEAILNDAIDKSQDRELALLAKAGYKFGLGNWDQAEIDFQSAFNAFPYSQNAGLQLADYYLARGKTQDALGVLQSLINYPNAGADPYNNMGDLYAGLAQWQDAIDAYNQALSIDPQFNQASIGLSNVLFQLGHGGEALHVLQDGVKVAPHDSTLFVALGDAYMNSLDYPSARTAYQQALEIDQKSTDALVGLDNLDRVEGVSSASLDELKKLAEDVPSADTYEALAAQFQARGMWQDALNWRQRATIIEPFNGSVWLNLGNQYLSLNDQSNAEPALTEAYKHLPGSSEVLLAMGSLKEAQGLDVEAETFYNQAINAAPNQIDAYVALSNLKVSLGDDTMALQLLQTGIQNAPGAIEGYQSLGSFYLAKENYQSAEESYSQGLTVIPSAAELFVDQGNLYIDEFQTANQNLANAEAYYPTALDYYNRSLALYERPETEQIKADALSNYQYAQRFLAEAQAAVDNSKSLPANAQAVFQQALSYQPNNTSAYLGLGSVAEINGQLDEAIQEYQQGIAINPYSADLWSSLGQIFITKGNMEAAQDAYQHMISISSNSLQEAAGIVSIGVAISPRNLTQTLDNVGYSQYRWGPLIQYLRHTEQ